MKIVIETKKGIIIIDASNWTLAQLADIASKNDIDIIQYIHR